MGLMYVLPGNTECMCAPAGRRRRQHRSPGVWFFTMKTKRPTAGGPRLRVRGRAMCVDYTPAGGPALTMSCSDYVRLMTLMSLMTHVTVDMI